LYFPFFVVFNHSIGVFKRRFYLFNGHKDLEDEGLLRRAIFELSIEERFLSGVFRRLGLEGLIMSEGIISKDIEKIDDGFAEIIQFLEVFLHDGKFCICVPNLN